MSETEAQARARRKYQKSCTELRVRLTGQDRDIIDFLNNYSGSKAAMVKRLLREEMARQAGRED